MTKSLLAKRTLPAVIAVSVLLIITGCASQSPEQPVPIPTDSTTPSTTPSTANKILYTNTDFNFTFELPLTWSGFTVVDGKWVGTNSATGKTVETGPLISLRNPLWTVAEKRQDIPIMVFTIAQWTALTAEDFHIGAAPISPSELARNNNYVFALPARYNYAFPAGYQEVEEILKANPLQAN